MTIQVTYQATGTKNTLLVARMGEASAESAQLTPIGEKSEVDKDSYAREGEPQTLRLSYDDPALLFHVDGWPYTEDGYLRLVVVEEATSHERFRLECAPRSTRGELTGREIHVARGFYALDLDIARMECDVSGDPADDPNQ